MGLALLCLGLNPLHAQFYDQEINFNPLNYFSSESTKTVTEIQGTNEAISVGTVEECNGCGTYDVSVTLFDPSGAVQWSIQYGQSGVNEVAHATLLNDFNDKIFVVGQTNGEDAFIMAIDVPSGAVNWSERLGNFSAGVVENLTCLTPTNPGSGEYMAMGTMINTSGVHHIYSVGFDDGGAILWTRVMDDYPGGFEMVPTNIALSTSGSIVPVVTGTLRVGGQVSIFTAHVDPTTGIISWFRTFNTTDGTNTGLDFSGDICYDPGTGGFALAFTSRNLYPSSGVSNWVTYLPITFWMNPTTGLAHIYSYTSGSYLWEWNFGIGIYEDGGHFDIGTRFGDYGGGIWDVVPAFLEVNPAGTVLSATAYNSNSPYFETSMHRGDDGYYIKSRRESTNFNINGLDFGGSTTTTCDWYPGINDNKAKVITNAYEMLNNNHGTHVNYSTPDNSTSGINYDCNGGSSSFKRDPLSVETTLQNANIYPTVVSAVDMVSISSTDFSGEQVQLVVTNALGQRIHTERKAMTADDVWTLQASHLTEGLNIVSVLDQQGQSLITSKIMKH